MLWLAALCGVGCVCAAGSAVLLTGQRRAAVALGGSLAFMALLMVLVCAGVTIARMAPPGSGGDAEELLEQMIERQVR